MTYVDVEPAPGRSAWRARLHDLAAFHGWTPHLFGADFPADLVCVRRPRVVWLFAEPDRGKLSRPRLAALLELRACGQEAVVVRPGDRAIVERILA